MYNVILTTHVMFLLRSLAVLWFGTQKLLIVFERKEICASGTGSDYEAGESAII